MPRTLFGSLESFPIGGGQTEWFCSLAGLEAAGLGAIGRLPVSIRIVLESACEFLEWGMQAFDTFMVECRRSTARP